MGHHYHYIVGQKAFNRAGDVTEPGAEQLADVKPGAFIDLWMTHPEAYMLKLANMQCTLNLKALNWRVGSVFQHLRNDINHIPFQQI